MTPQELADALGWHLLCLGVSHDHAELLEFVRDVWPFVCECPDPGRLPRTVPSTASTTSSRVTDRAGRARR